MTDRPRYNTDLTVDQRLDLWLHVEAARYGDPDPADYVACMRDAVAGRFIRLGFELDNLAATGPVGKFFAFLLGWRPADAREREHVIDTARRIL